MNIPLHILLIKTTGAILLLLVTIIIVLFVIILLNSPGEPNPYIGLNGQKIEDSISEKGYINVNNAQLGYFIKGKNTKNPVLLYLHGGMPDYFLTERFPTGLDDIFTVVWLEQRGAGLSFKSKFSENATVINTLVKDVVSVTEYLKKRFTQEKIYLMGHSGGTYLGVKVIEKHPDLFNAYIGVAQISYQKLSEKKAYEYIMERYKDNPKQKKSYDILLEHPIDLNKPIPQEYTDIRDKVMHELGIGTMRNMKNVVTGIFIPSLLFSEYSINEKFNLWKGKANSGISIIWDDMINHDLSIENNNFAIPFYVLHGIYDYTCSYELSKDYFEKINAPRKGFYTFNNSAHSPIFEEPEETVKVIKKNILK